MAKLICLSLAPGRLLEIGDHRYRVVERCVDQSIVRLRRVDSTNETLDISMNQLASFLVVEKATLIDDLDIPDPEPEPEPDEDVATPRRTVTDITHLPISRVIDWHGKIYILKCLMQLGPCSPKSVLFRAEVAEANKELVEWRNGVGLSGFKLWSMWTLYHDLLRWRQQRYDLAAIQRKGVEYIPWQNRKSDFYVAAAAMVNEMGLEFPHLSKAAIHRKLNQKLSAKADSIPEVEQ